MKFYLSPKELSQAVDLSESTIKRWVDQGKIQAEKTEGGHRKIAVETAIQFIRTNKIPLAKPEIFGFSELKYLSGDPLASASASDQFHTFLLTGQAEKAKGLIIYLYLNGSSVAGIIDGPIQSSMARIGELWKHDQTGIGIEHRATDICIQTLNGIRTIFQPAQNAPIALGGAPSGDPYILPSLSVATVLASEGMKAINYGPNTPFEVFHSAIAQYQPHLVWLSISYKKRGIKFDSAMEELVQVSDQYGSKLIIGGKESQNRKVNSQSNIHCIGSLVELVAFIKGLKAKTAIPSRP